MVSSCVVYAKVFNQIPGLFPSSHVPRALIDIITECFVSVLKLRTRTSHISIVYQSYPLLQWRRSAGSARSNDLAGRSTVLVPPCLLFCFGNSVSRKLNNVTISDRFICFILTVKQSAALAACVLRETTKKVVNFFEEISASGDLP